MLDQGREFKNTQTADAAVKQEMERLALERKNLVENVKKLDEAMLAAFEHLPEPRQPWHSGSLMCCRRWRACARKPLVWTAHNNFSITPHRLLISGQWPQLDSEAALVSW